MRNRDRDALLTSIGNHSQTLSKARVKAAQRRLHEWGGLGWPAGSGGRGNGVNKPVERLVQRLGCTVDGCSEPLKCNHWKSDEFARASAELDEHLVAAEHHLAKAHKLVLAATSTTRAVPPAGCKLCAEVNHPNSFQPVYTKGLCSFCAGFLERYHVEPSPKVRRYHLDHPGSRVPREIIREEHPQAYAEVHAA